MTIHVTGRLTITKLPRGTNTLLGCNDLLRYGETVFEDHNLVVNIGMQVFSRMLGGNAGLPGIGSPAGSTPWGSSFADINDIAVGSMIIGNTSSPATPAPGDTSGVGSPVYTPYLTVTYPTAYSVNFGGLIPITEANNPSLPGDTAWYLTEEALYLKNGLLFAKKTFRVAKNDTHALQVNHAFTFAEA